MKKKNLLSLFLLSGFLASCGVTVQDSSEEAPAPTSSETSEHDHSHSGSDSSDDHSHSGGGGGGSSSEEDPCAHGHTLLHYAAQPATCTTSGTLEVYRCLECGEYFLTKPEGTVTETTSKLRPDATKIYYQAPLGHDLSDWIIDDDPTCQTLGHKHKECSRCDYEETETIEKGEHAYGPIVYTWNDAKTEFTATRHCAHGHDDNETVKVTKIVVEPTCTEEGYTSYQAGDFKYSYFEPADPSEKVIMNIEPALGHNLVHRDYTPKTCTDNGYIEHYHCDRCNKDYLDPYGNTLATESVIEQATGHNLISHAKVDPTCSHEGTRAYDECSVCGAILINNQKIADSYIEVKAFLTISKEPHDFTNAVSYSWNADHSVCTGTATCNVCGEVVNEQVGLLSQEAGEGKTIYTSQEFHNDPFTQQMVEVLDCSHDYHIDTEKSHNATCLLPQETVYVCSICGDSYTVIGDPATGHEYAALTEEDYVWSSDNSSVTVTRECTSCHDHQDVTTVKTTSVTTAPDCESAGNVTYTATFNKEGFTTQQKVVPISPTGHDFGQVIYTWEPDFSSVEAKRVCKNNPAHVETEVVIPTYDANEDVAPTCEENGSRYYTATFTNEAFETQYKTQTLPRLNHEYHAHIDDDSWAVSSVTGKMECTVTAICANDPTHTKVQTVEATEVTDPATCTTDGSTTYTATFSLEVLPIDERIAQKVVVLQAFDHDYDYANATYTWNTEHTACSAEAICKHDSEHVLHVDATNISSDVTPATCGVAGKTTYTATFAAPFANQVAEVEIPALTHEWHYDDTKGDDGIVFASDGKTATVAYVCHNVSDHYEYRPVEVTSEITRDPTCSLVGQTTYSVTYEDEEHNIHNASVVKDDIAIVESAHSWVGPQYSDWDNLNITATYACENNHDHDIVENVTATYSSTKTAATCTGNRVDIYTANFEHDVFAAQSKEVEVANSALGHSFGTPTYTWKDPANNDYSTCYAERVCTRDSSHKEYETATTVHTTTTVGTTNYDVYTATFTNEAFAQQVIQIEATCTHEGTTHSDIVAPTCEEQGYTKHVCDNCGAVVSIDDYVDALGHDFDYEHPEYEWNSDHTACVATVTCKRTGCDKTDTTNSVNVTSVTTPNTCTADGSIVYTATFTKEHYPSSSEDIVVLHKTGHDMTYHEAVAPTCTTDGNVAYWHCANCNKNFLDEEGENEIADVVIAKTGHDWQAATYNWNEDHSECTATRVCGNDPLHIETETVKSTLVHVDPQCEVAGSDTYTAEFENDAFTTQVYEVEIEALEHDYHVLKDGYVWAYNELTDKMECTVTTTCSHNSAHTKTQKVDATIIDENPATCEEAGSITYQAVFDLEELSTEEKTVNKVVEVPATGHEYGDIQFSWAKDYSTATGTRVCAHDSSHKLTTEAPVLSSYSVISDPKCGVVGLGRYTVEITIGDLTQSDSVDVEITALSHSWAGPYYKWENNDNVLKEYIECNNDSEHNHTQERNVYTKTNAVNYTASGKVPEVFSDPTQRAANGYGDINFFFKSNSDSRAYHSEARFRLTNSSLDNAKNNFMIKVGNDYDYRTTTGSGDTSMYFYSNLEKGVTGTVSSDRGYTVNTPTDTRPSGIDNATFWNDYIAFTKDVTVNVVIDSNEDGLLTITVTYYSHVDANSDGKVDMPQYLGYTQTVTAQIGSSDHTWGDVRSIRIVRGSETETMKIDYISFTESRLDDKDVLGYTYDKYSAKWTKPVITHYDGVHDIVAVPLEGSTCYSHGHNAYYVCEGCGAYFSDSEGEHPADYSSFVRPLAAHVMEPHVENGTAMYHCTVCDQYFLDEEGTQKTDIRLYSYAWSDNGVVSKLSQTIVYPYDNNRTETNSSYKSASYDSNVSKRTISGDLSPLVEAPGTVKLLGDINAHFTQDNGWFSDYGKDYNLNLKLRVTHESVLENMGSNYLIKLDNSYTYGSTRNGSSYAAITSDLETNASAYSFTSVSDNRLDFIKKGLSSEAKFEQDYCIFAQDADIYIDIDYKTATGVFTIIITYYTHIGVLNDKDYSQFMGYQQTITGNVNSYRTWNLINSVRFARTDANSSIKVYSADYSSSIDRNICDSNKIRVVNCGKSDI